MINTSPGSKDLAALTRRIHRKRFCAAGPGRSPQALAQGHDRSAIIVAGYEDEPQP